MRRAYGMEDGAVRIVGGHNCSQLSGTISKSIQSNLRSLNAKLTGVEEAHVVNGILA